MIGDRLLLDRKLGKAVAVGARFSLRDRQEITWAFECLIAPHLGSLLNRENSGFLGAKLAAIAA